MRYASLRKMDISNGEYAGVSLFVQGCPYHCPGCFNPDTHDFLGGKEWTDELEEKFMQLIDKPHIKRVSFLGGEPLARENVCTVNYLIEKIRRLFPDKKIWLWTGNTFENILKKQDEFDNERISVISKLDFLIDGPFIEGKKNLNLKWRGSENQNVYNIKKTKKNIGIDSIEEWTPEILREKKKLYV